MKLLKKPKIAFCTTTIYMPHFLEGFAKNFLKNKHQNIIFYIIGDKKTPIEVSDYITKLNKKYPYEFKYYDYLKVKKIYKQFPRLAKLTKFGTGIMKFIAVYLSYLDNCDLNLHIDDDNFVLEKDYLSEAMKLAKPSNFKLIKSQNEWFNIYKLLKEKKNREFYPRAYPWSKRNKKSHSKLINKRIEPIFFNGSVFGDPDVDAVTRLYADIQVTGFKNKKIKQYGLYPGTWTSFNNQNSGMIRDLIPVYFTPFSTGRNADIWGSYMICKIAEIHKKTIFFGKPVVTQLRNPHNLWKDLMLEYQNDYMTDKFVNILKGLKVIKQKSYLLTCKQICDKAIKVIKNEKISKIDKNYLLNFFYEYQKWNKLF